ncbi:MAG TPA: FtsX-like permease family protein [Kofleriaceae bacterium]|nr:FtsX-like permease family protein [Kofleriaceae bacterium]
MHFIPILSTLRRHRTAAVLIVLEIALTCAIVCNAIFLIGDRLHRMDQPSGVAENELLRIGLTGIGTKADAGSLTAQDLAALRAIPGVKSAATIDMVPFGGSSWNSSISLGPEDAASSVNAGMYMGGPDLIDTLGLQLVAGRGFTADEMVDFDAAQAQKVHIPSIILTRGAARRLFQDKNPIGQPVYVWGKQPQIVVGVIDQIARPNEVNGPELFDCAMLLPVRLTYTNAGNYVVRVDPARLDEVNGEVEQTLDNVDPSRIILEHETFHQIRREHFKGDRAMAYLLVGVCLALLVITALGVVGLASFWVQQRTRQIGIRRALGATKRDIVHYFQMENFILATLGIVLGMALAYGVNLWLMGKYHVPRLPAEFLPIGASLLWLLGQVAVLGPALRAAAIPPAIATRSV